MSNTNANVRSIRDKFQQPHQASLTKTRQEQKHDIVFPCSHCGKHQTISLLLPFNETQGLSWPEKQRSAVRSKKRVAGEVLRTGASRHRNQCPCPQDLFTILLTCQRVRTSRRNHRCDLSVQISWNQHQFGWWLSATIRLSRRETSNRHQSGWWLSATIRLSRWETSKRNYEKSHR